MVWGTPLTKYIDEGQVQGCVLSYRGAKLLDLCDVIFQYTNKKLNTVVVIAGFNGLRSSIEISIEHWKFLIQFTIVKFSSNNLIVHKVIPSRFNRLINKKISALYNSLYNYIDFCALKLFIVSSSFRKVLEPNLFYKDTSSFMKTMFPLLFCLTSFNTLNIVAVITLL